MRKTYATIIGVSLGIGLAGSATIALAGRDSSGTMTFNSVSGGYPFQPGVISRTAMNAHFSELAAELTDSASRSGKGGFTAPVRAADGSASLPAFSWTSDTNTGLYRVGADIVGLSLGGTEYVDFSTTATTVRTSILRLNAGSDQEVRKSGGTLLVGTADANRVDLYTQAAARFTVNSDGTMDAHGNAIGNVGTPTADTHAATKAYVDAQASSTTITAGTDWTQTVGVVSKSGKVASLHLRSTAGASSAWTSIGTIGAGFLPVDSMYVSCVVMDNSSGTYYTGHISIDYSTGVIQLMFYDNGTSLVSPFVIGANDYLICAGSYPVP